MVVVPVLSEFMSQLLQRGALPACSCSPSTTRTDTISNINSNQTHNNGIPPENLAKLSASERRPGAWETSFTSPRRPCPYLRHSWWRPVRH